MNNERFEKIFEKRIKLIKQILLQKGKEYSPNKDRLHNFKVAARKRNTTPEDALMGMKIKHDVSVDDIVNNLKKGMLPNNVLLEEKIGDSINYLILLEALIKERLSKK